MPLSDADKIINLEDLAAFKAKMDESVLHKTGSETVSGEKVFSGSQTMAAGNVGSLLVIKDPDLVKGETPEKNHYLSIGFIDSTGNSYLQDSSSRLGAVEYKSPSEADPEGYIQMAYRGFNGESAAALRVGYDGDSIKFASVPATSEDRDNPTDIVTRDYLPKSKAIPQFPDLWNWQKTEKASAVTVKPVPESDLEPVVDFLFTETPPAEGAKSPDNPSTITGVSQVKVSTKGSNLFCIPPQTKTMFGVDMTIGEDGIITFDGTSTYTARNNFGIRVDFPVNVKCSPGMTIKLSFIPVSGSATSVMSDRPYNAGLQQGVYNSDGSVLRYANCTDVVQNFTYTIPENIYDLYIGPRQYLYIDKGASFDNYKFKINVELLTDVGWDVPAAWNNYAIELDGTFYGGSLDVATGVMTVTWVGVVYDGTETITKQADLADGTPQYNLPVPSYATTGGELRIVSTHFPFGYTANCGYVRTSAGTGYCVYPVGYETLESFTAWVASQYAAGTPLTVAYKVATPYTVQLTPTQILSLPALDKYEPRINTVYTDQQAVQVGYQKYAGGAVKALGTTAVRTLPERFSDVVNVKDFGAVGDGVTDDTAAIQSAFDYAVSKEEPCCIYFPQGIFAVRCTEPATVRTFAAGIAASFTSPVEITGCGAVLKADPDSNSVNILCSITTTADIFLHDITVDCNDMVETGIDIYRTPNSSGTRKPYADCRIDNITIKNAYKWSTALTDSALYITGEFRTVIIDGAIINKCVASANALSLGIVGVYGITINRTKPAGGETVASNNVFLNNITVEDVYCEDSSYTYDQDAIRIFSNYKPDDAKINLDSALVNNVYCRNIRGRIAKCQMHYVTFNNANLVNDGDSAGFVGIAENRGVIENQCGGVNINNMNVYVKNSHICASLVRSGHIVTLEQDGTIKYPGISYQGGINISNVKAVIVLDSILEDSFNTGFNAFVFALHGESGKNSIDNNLSGSYIFNFSNVIIESNYSFNTFVNFTRGSAVRPIFYNLSNCIASCRSTFVRTTGESTEKNISVNMVNVKNTDASPHIAFTYEYVKKASFSNVDGFTLGPTASRNIQNMVPVVFCNGDPQSTPKVTDVVIAESVAGICNVGILGAEVEDDGETTYYNARLHLGTKSYPDVANIRAVYNPSYIHTSNLMLGVEDTYFVVLNDESFSPSDGSNLQLGSSSSHWSSGYIDAINTKSVFTAPSSVSNDSVDVSEGTVFTKTVSADTDFSFTGVPSGKTAEFMLLLSDGGAYSVTWPSSVKWAGGTAPTLTASGTDVLRFITPDGGATWYGKVDVADAS